MNRDEVTVTKCPPGLAKGAVGIRDISDLMRPTKDLRRAQEKKQRRLTRKQRRKAREIERVKSAQFLESYAWRKVRYEVLKKHGARCQCCGRKPPHVTIHVDHIKPRKKYPELALDPDNLQVLCHECNHGKGNWDETDWRPK